MAKKDDYFVIEELLDDFSDFISEMEENHHLIEQSLLQSDRDRCIEEQFREVMQALHTMKGSSNCYSIRPLVDIVHALETLMQWVLKGEIEFDQNIVEIVLLCMDRIYKTTKELGGGGKSYVGDFDPIIHSMINLSEADKNNRSALVRETLKVLTNQQIIADDIDKVKDISNIENADSIYADLSFFKSLSEEVDKRHDHWQGRTEYITRLALEMNSTAGEVVDKNQLEVAIYLHDIGMGFMPDDLINKPEKLTHEEMSVMRNHPTTGYELIKRISQWEDAALYILEHHEYFDGSGYPASKKGEDISDGARILAICDAFYAITHERPDRTSPRSFLRALAEINGCVDSQFCPYWTKIFNKVIQSRAKRG